MLPIDKTFDIGSKTGTPVDDQDYQIPFAFTGKIDKLTMVEPPKLTPEDEKRLEEAWPAELDRRSLNRIPATHPCSSLLSWKGSHALEKSAQPSVKRKFVGRFP
jgi:hypothetical protein